MVNTEFLRTSTLTTMPAFITDSIFTYRNYTDNTPIAEPPDSGKCKITLNSGFQTDVTPIMKKKLTGDKTYYLSKYINGSKFYLNSSSKFYSEWYIYYSIDDNAVNATPKQIYILCIEMNISNPNEDKVRQFYSDDCYSMTIPHKHKMNVQELWNPVVNEKWLFQCSGTSTQFTLSGVPI